MQEISYTFERKRLLPGFDGKFCKVCPSVLSDGENNALLLYTTLNLSGSDVFHGDFCCKSTDGGKSFSAPKQMRNLDKTVDGIRYHFSGCEHFYHKQKKIWLGVGCVLGYADEHEPYMVNGVTFGKPVYLPIDFNSQDWVGEPLDLPFPYESMSIFSHGQPLVYPNGEILLTFYFAPQNQTMTQVVSVKYKLDDNNRLQIVEAGEPIACEKYGYRGLAEPSAAYLNGKYYMTIRDDDYGLLSYSDDGLHFTSPEIWKWDDGSLLENYNTMQRWIRTEKGLFLAYTRRGAHNDHVFRHRAPLFMTRFDEERKCLIRSEEIILVPELGARLGNFFVTEASEKESWLITAEWMQTTGPDVFDWTQCVKYGSDNSLWLVKLFFE